MQIRALGKQGLHASAQGLGCMSLTKGFYHDDSTLGPEEPRIDVIRTALSNGVTLLNTADFYGPYDNHKLIAKAIQGIPREQVVISSKWGIEIDEEHKFSLDFSPEYCRKALVESLKRLGVDYIDLLVMRSKDPHKPIEESIKAMAELVKEGLIKGIGLSEVSAEDVRRAHAVHPITAVEMEWSLFARSCEDSLVPTCRELGIAFLAYSPMSRGMLTGKVSLDQLAPHDARHHMPQFQAMQQNQLLVEKVSELAKRKGCTAGQLALAWVHHQGDDVFPIPGTKNPKYVLENIAAFDVRLSKEELAELEEAVPRSAVTGHRFPASHAKLHSDE
ncbi:hypothetical protein ABBQ32_000822 [Trebouxia sp. C0010 RCD-2024]